MCSAWPVPLRRCGPTPKPVCGSGGEATLKVCGVGVAMLSGSRRASPSSIDSVVNVGTVPGRPSPPGSRSGWWAGPLPTGGRGMGRRSRSSPSTREACTWRRGPASRQGGHWNARRRVGEYRRIRSWCCCAPSDGYGRSRPSCTVGRDDPHLRIHGPRTGLVERPLPGNGHGGCGRRLGETHRWKHRQGAPGRPHGLRPHGNPADSRRWDAGPLRAPPSRRVRPLTGTPRPRLLTLVRAAATARPCRVGCVPRSEPWTAW